jgi:hypothetical protein
MMRSHVPVSWILILMVSTMLPAFAAIQEPVRTDGGSGSH